MHTVCVEIAVGSDPDLPDAMASLQAQTRRPDRVLLAAAASTPGDLIARALAQGPSLTVEIGRFSGGIVGARSGSLDRIHEEITAFLDSDEVAPPAWLDRLVAPIEGGTADFSGGPTRPRRPAEHPIQAYTQLLEESIYADLVPSSVAYLPLQNTAWRTSDLRRLGFDRRIPGAEDYDLEVRALAGGLRGRFVAEAWVLHDKSSETSYRRWLRKRYAHYLLPMAMALIKNRSLAHRLGERRAPVRHPLRYVDAMMKPIALVDAWIRWRGLRETA